MANDPRSPNPRAPQPPQDPLDLLRELARNRAPEADEQAAPDPAAPSDEKFESLRALAQTLDRQLRGTSGEPSGPEPDPLQEAPHESGPLPDPSLEASPYQLPPSAGAADWRHAALLEWAAFRDGLPSAPTLLPRLRLPEIVFVAIAVVVLVAAALGGYIHHRRALAPAGTEPVPPLPSSTVPNQSPAAIEPRPPTLADVQKAMSECDAAAAQDVDGLYFLVLPLLRTDASWQPVPLQTIGSSYLLLGASDAVDGLRDGKLAVRPDRYTFSVLDMLSGATYSWTSATGMVRLARKDTGGVKTLKLGFDFSPNQIGAQWSAEFKRDRGTCYWVSVLVQ